MELGHWTFLSLCRNKSFNLEKENTNTPPNPPPLNISLHSTNMQNGGKEINEAHIYIYISKSIPA
jgi:hypothetical protein